MKTKLLILKTNIRSKKKLQILVPAFNGHGSIQRWSVDLEDKDKVLRIVGDEAINEREIIELVKNQGFYAEDLEG
jgi:hypothetical protein